MKETLTLRRSGAFNCELKGDHHCGVKGGASEAMLIKYSVHVKCTTKLDGRGFLFEQLGVDNFFSQIRETELSCEQLAMDCAHKLVQQIIGENPGIEIITLEVEISPYPHMASMTYRYDAKASKRKVPLDVTIAKANAKRRPRREARVN